MPWNVGDIIQMICFQEINAQTVINTLYYRVANIDAGDVSDDNLNELAKTIVDFIADTQVDSLLHVEQIFNNLTDGLSQHVSAYTTTGIGVDPEYLPPFNAVGLKKNVASRITRPGSIRIAGIAESSVSQGVLTVAAKAAYTVLGVNIQDAITSVSLDGSIVTYDPVVVGRNPLGQFDLARINDITTIASPRITTQNSRKET